MKTKRLFVVTMLLTLAIGLNSLPFLWDVYLASMTSPEVENIGYMPGEVISVQTGVLDICPPGVGPHGEDDGSGDEGGE
ncbi:MAG: hypothetical protein KAW17_09570 [Candidatus Eisenbacteria sp.]|nr:hypothetical protein [Candidatus Eisenbacteria bacterium]